AEARDAIGRLARADAPLLEGLADLQLKGSIPGDRLAAAPFVGAALQAWFSALAGGLEPVTGTTSSGDCPICGARPVAGVIDGTTRRRHLHCSLCGAAWNVLRSICVSCGDDAGLCYLHLEHDESAKAEACGGCGGYVKLFDQERRAGVEPVADDAATLALDLLLAREGYRRLGASPFLAVAAS
ncbi:MAG: formate dehydrogenase accessory protein FdhE, partial [Anaeromyxobacteraceae bacterium]